MSGVYTPEFVAALENPVVIWEHPIKGEVKVLHEGFDLSKFSVNFSGPPGTTPLTGIATTPRTVLRSMHYHEGHHEHVAVQTTVGDVRFIAEELYAKRNVMRKYATGAHYPDAAAAYEKAHARAKFFSGWWSQGSPLSGMMALDNVTGERIGIFNIGGSDRGPTAAECAAIVAKPYQDNGVGTEVAVAGMFFFPKAMREAGFNMRDGVTPFESITFTARTDNAGFRIAEKLKLTAVDETQKYGTTAKDRRVVFQDSVDSLIDVVDSTVERAQLKATFGMI